MNKTSSLPPKNARAAWCGPGGLLAFVSVLLVAGSCQAAGPENTGIYQIGIWNVIMNDWLLRMLVLLIALLFCGSVIFAFYAVMYRTQNNRKAKRWARLEAEWAPKVMSIFDNAADVESIGKTVSEEDELFFIDFLMRYARRIRGEELENISKLARPYLDKIAGHLNLDSASQRAHAVQTLGLLGFHLYVKELIVALDDKSPLVAMIAARSLAREDHPQYIEPVLNRLYRFEQWNPRFLSSMLVGVGRGAAPFLRKAYADKLRPASLRAVVAEALRELNDLPATGIAYTILHDEVTQMKSTAPLFIINENEPDDVNRELGPEAEVQTMLSERGKYIHPRRDLIASSLRILRSYGQPEHADVVRELIASPDFVIRAFALRALGKLGSLHDLPCLRSAMDDPSVWVTIHAARAMRELGDDSRLREIAASRHQRIDVARQVLAEGII